MQAEKELMQRLSDFRQEMVDSLVEISRIPAVNPAMEGEGEYARAQWVCRKLEEWGIEYVCHDVPDDRVKEGVRPNIQVRFPAREETDKTLWFIAHLDTVSAGDISLWETDPFDPVVKDGKIYGLGCEDNTQAVIEGLYLARILQESGFRAKKAISFLFVSDEETGSQYGLHALIEKGLFSAQDEALVPDGGCPDGSFVEVAEKSQVWLRITTNGKQGHAAMPHLALNACSAGMHLAVEIEDSLKEKFSVQDPLFEPPGSTFELTQKFSNVASPNVLPGQDVFTLDMRILPCYTVETVMEHIDTIISKYEQNLPGLRIEKEFVTCVKAPPPTPTDADVVVHLMSALKQLGIPARTGGIGGGTCAAILREQNIPAVVWSHVDDLCHQPNEYAVAENLYKDAQVFLTTFFF